MRYPWLPCAWSDQQTALWPKMRHLGNWLNPLLLCNRLLAVSIPFNIRRKRKKRRIWQFPGVWVSQWAKPNICRPIKIDLGVWPIRAAINQENFWTPVFYWHTNTSINGHNGNHLPWEHVERHDHGKYWEVQAPSTFFKATYTTQPLLSLDTYPTEISVKTDQGKIAEQHRSAVYVKSATKNLLGNEWFSRDLGLRGGDCSHRSKAAFDILRRPQHCL
jgi:hypothetical protein